MYDIISDNLWYYLIDEIGSGDNNRAGILQQIAHHKQACTANLLYSLTHCKSNGFFLIKKQAFIELWRLLKLILVFCIRGMDPKPKSKSLQEPKPEPLNFMPFRIL
jgi:hypothetical protein